MNNKKEDLKYYESLIESELNNLSTIRNDENIIESNEDAPKKKKLKKSQSKKISNLELCVAIYRLLIFNFKKYSTKYNYAKLINLIKIDDQNENDQLQQQQQQNFMVKYFTLKIYSLLLSLTPLQEEALFSKHFNSEQLENVYLK
jgi:hypothetical protein